MTDPNKSAHRSPIPAIVGCSQCAWLIEEVRDLRAKNAELTNRLEWTREMWAGALAKLGKARSLMGND